MILTDAELELLLKVPTTVEQAHRIAERNQALLAALEGREKYKGNIGCPHCSWPHQCSTCAWAEAFEYRGPLPCCDATFGGVTLGDTIVEYSDDSEEIDATDGEIDSEGLDNTKIFLQGHIEWALEVIRVGGVPWPDGDKELSQSA